jgi:hypothetical protein
MDRVLFSSFNHYSIVKLKKIDSFAKTAFLFGDGYMDMPKYVKKYGVEALHPALYNLQYPGFTEECEKEKIPLNVWTVNEEEHIRFVCAKRVNGFFTDFPDRARKVVDEYEHDLNFAPEAEYSGWMKKMQRLFYIREKRMDISKQEIRQIFIMNIIESSGKGIYNSFSWLLRIHGKYGKYYFILSGRLFGVSF